MIINIYLKIIFYKMATIGVKETTLSQVKKIAKLQGISNGDFVELAAEFFLKTGIDLKEGYSIKAEIKENNKRLNQVIAWTTKQEKELIYPVFKAIQENNIKTEEYLKRLKPERIETAFKDVSNAFRELNNKIEQSNQARLSLEKLLNQANKKNTILLELFSLERDFKGSIKDKTSEAELRNELRKF